MTAYNPNLDADDTADTDGPGFRVPALLAALRQGAFPLVPEALRTAVEALERADGLEREVMGAPPEGLAPFVKRVAADVLGGRGLPVDFAEAAFTAQQSADRLNAKSIAVAELRRAVQAQFPHVVASCLPELLAGLRDQLATLLTELRAAVADIGDLDTASPQAVAAATDPQRAALLALEGLRGRYHRLRLAQRAALQASSVRPPGVTQMTVDHGWREVFAAGIHEFGNVRELGAVSMQMGKLDRLRLLADRDDVWLPDVAELHQAWAELHPPPTVTVVKHPVYDAVLARSAS